MPGVSTTATGIPKGGLRLVMISGYHRLMVLIGMVPASPVAAREQKLFLSVFSTMNDGGRANMRGS